MGVKRTPCQQRRKRENRLAVSYPHAPRPGRSSVSSGTLGIMTWPFHHIRWKIVLPYAFLTVVLATAGSYVPTRLVTGSLSERFDNQLAEAGRVVADTVVRKEREHLATVRAVAFTEGVPEAVRAADKTKVAGLAGPIAGNAKVERLLDAAGQRLKTFSLTDEKSLTYEELTDTDNPAAWPLVQETLQGDADQLGDKYAQIVQTSEGFVLYTAGPITAGGKVVGAVLVGTTLDSFVRQTKTAALADVTIYDFLGGPLASTFARPDDASADEAPLAVGAEALDEATWWWRCGAR